MAVNAKDGGYDGSIGDGWTSIGGLDSGNVRDWPTVTTPAVLRGQGHPHRHNPSRFFLLHWLESGRMSVPASCSMFIKCGCCHHPPKSPSCVAGWGFLFDKAEEGVMGAGMETKWQVHWRSWMTSGNRMFRKQKEGPRILCRGWRWIVAPSSQKAAEIHTSIFKSDAVEMVLPSSRAM